MERGQNREAFRLADQIMLEEELALQSLRELVGSTRTSEEVDAELYNWRNYGKV